MMPVIAAFLIWMTLMAAEFLYAQRLTQYRLDIQPGEPFWRGRSVFTQFNVSRSANYTPEAREKLRGLHAVSVLRLIASFGFYITLARLLFSIAT